MSNAELIRNLQEAMQSRSRPAPYDATAVVTRVDGTTAWVRLAGSDTETPIKRTIDAKAGDVVQVRVGGGSAWINGNQSAPPTDDTTAIEVKQKTEAVEKTVETTVQTLEKVADVANDAKDTAIAGKAIAEATDQYFWSDANGAHVALTPKGTDPNGATGFNSLWNMLGLLLRNGGNILAQFGQNGIAFYDGRGNNAANVLASFGTSGIRVGKSGQTNIQIAPDQVEMTAPNGSTAMVVSYEPITDFSGDIDYGIHITDEHDQSYIDLIPSSDGEEFDGSLELVAVMENYRFLCDGGNSIEVGNGGFLVYGTNGSIQLNVDNTGNITVRDQEPLIVYEDVYETVSYNAGTIGTMAVAISLGTTTKSGYRYIGATVLNHSNTSSFWINLCRNANNGNAYAAIYRASASAVDGMAITVRKMWMHTKISGEAE